MSTGKLSQSLSKGHQGGSLAATVLALRPRPVCVLSSSGQLAAPVHQAVLLGSSNGYYVLIEEPSRTVWRVPTGMVALHSRVGGECR